MASSSMGADTGSVLEQVADGLTVAELDERGLLQRIFPRLGGAPAAAVPVGPGDDAAVVAAPDGRTALSIDTLVQDQDFRLLWPAGYRTTGFDVGWKCAAQNLSDINAMGAEATSLVVSLTLPGSTAVAWVEDLADGLRAALAGLGAPRCAVVGGDLGGGPALVVTAAVTGDLGGRAPVLRSGARAGDLLAVTGSPGRAAAGLALLESRHPYEELPAALQELVAAQSRPTPPLALGPLAAQAGAHAMMDVSDGLVRDAGRLARASQVAIELDPQALLPFARPLAGAATLTGADPLAWVLAGGEDHGLLAAFGPRTVPPAGFTVVGRVSDGAGQVTVGGAEPGAVGWDHFAG
ncbi:thiamine-phosphate kinase [Arthrobacter sp. I2-34]|uniref:Thiamine-monophosphate kinase n=1 Tax=Arthrobacter hankyongi TaxID=2904801 RepID=A0ABS9L6Q5_9MICC|nr:thiamine-phosphate kinase [Arthrobacter hankyongi]MCG2622360.1 thiamine-phosphate kinase [Arthrobacter hankyongi]